MNKKYISLILIPALLSGCSSAIKLKFVPYSTYVEEHDYMIDDSGTYFKREKETTPVTYKNGTVNCLSDLLSDFKSGQKRECIESKGDKKLLVIPISFTDSDTYQNEKKKNEKTIFLQNAFFGENKRTNYYSVAGYYNASSYGQLKLTGEVAPWFESSLSSKEVERMANGTYMTISQMLTCQAVDYLKKSKDLSEYDTDNDGLIDGVYAIYDHPYNEKNSKSIFWAYTHYIENETAGYNLSEPFVNEYSWTSIDAVIQKDNRSNTNYLIHETGHLLGLTDYYNTNLNIDNNYHYQPTGCFDMMDYNIGDHSAFSKYLFKWSSPMVVKDNIKETIKLHPFTTSGEYLLVPSSKYNNSPFSEYLLIEYFAPTGLNKFSGAYTYTDKDGNDGIYRYPQYYGLRIYHINATLGYFKKSLTSHFICTVDDEDWESKVGTDVVGLDFAYSNTIKDSDVGRVPALIHLLESSGKNTFKDGIPANNNTLFRVGDDFGITKFTDFKFSNGEEINFKLKVKDLSTRDITIEISTKW